MEDPHCRSSAEVAQFWLVVSGGIGDGRKLRRWGFWAGSPRVVWQRLKAQGSDSDLFSLLVRARPQKLAESHGSPGLKGVGVRCCVGVPRISQVTGSWLDGPGLRVHLPSTTTQARFSLRFRV